jgi:hypothetical protein
LKDEKTLKKYHDEIGKLLEKDKEQQMSQSEGRWQYVKQVIVSVVYDVTGYEQGWRRNDWFDDEYKKAYEAKSRARIKMVNRETRSNVDDYKQCLRWGGMRWDGSPSLFKNP